MSWHASRAVSLRQRLLLFGTETDDISDVNKIYSYGFTERVDSSASLLAALDSLKRRRVLP